MAWRLAFLTFPLLLAGCLKTAEQVRREQRIESMSQELSDSQNIVADLTVLLKNLQAQIDTLNGQVEEMKRQDAQQVQEIKMLDQNLTLLRKEADELRTLSQAQGKEIEQQRGFIEKVTEKLGKLNAPAAKASSEPKDAKDDLARSRKLIAQKKYAEARSLLEGMVGDAGLSAADQNKVFHALGELEFAQKNWEKSLVFFSKIYTKYPKSSLAPSSLLHIGKALDQLGKKAESAQAFEELKANYPSSAAAKEVR